MTSNNSVQHNRTKKTLIILLVVLLLAGFAMLLVGCSDVVNVKYEVMLTSGIGYDVTSTEIVEVERGGTVSFEIEIEENYELYNTSVGEFKDGILTVAEVNYSMTVIFDVRSTLVSVEYMQENCVVQLYVHNSNREIISGEKADVKFIADENYNIDKLYLNEELVDIEIQDYRNATAEIVLTDNMVFDARVLGDEYEFLLKHDKYKGDVEILESTIVDDTPRYGDVVTIIATPKSPYTFISYRINDEIINDSAAQTITITEKTVANVEFFNENSGKIIYNANGGQFDTDVENAVESNYYDSGEYVNIDHCYNKIVRDGYSLIGLSEGIDGTIHALGGMVKVPQGTIEMYAVWKQWSSSSNFAFEEDANGNYIVTGYSSPDFASSVTEIVIPEIHNGKPVVGIAANAFRDSSALVSVYFSKNIVIIGDKAFNNCANLTNIMLFETTITKADNAFDNCPKFTTCEINATSGADNHDGYHSSLAFRFAQVQDRDREKSIILISGSSGCLGIDTDMFLAQFPDYGLIVIGVQRGMGILPMLSIVADNVMDGDIVVITPEYFENMWGNTEQYNQQEYNYKYIQKNYNVMKSINLLENPNLFKSFDELFKGKKSGGVMTSSLSDYGVNKFWRGHNASIYEEEIDFNNNLITANNLSQIKNHAYSIIAENAKVYFSFPPLMKETLLPQYDEKYRSDFLFLLKQTINDGDTEVIPVISDMEDYMMERKYFHDSVYHLSTEGAKVRSGMLVNDIKAQLAKEGIA